MPIWNIKHIAIVVWRSIWSYVLRLPIPANNPLRGNSFFFFIIIILFTLYHGHEGSENDSNGNDDDAFWKQRFLYNMTLIFIVWIQSLSAPVMINCRACYFVIIIYVWVGIIYVRECVCRCVCVSVCVCICACTARITHYNIFTAPQTWKLFYFPKQRSFPTTQPRRRVYINARARVLNNNILGPVFLLLRISKRTLQYYRTVLN